MQVTCMRYDRRGTHTRTFVAPIHGGSYSGVFLQRPKEFAILAFAKKIARLA
jgi:hypothetical protein